jgi:C1A family cysteine protease
MTLIFTRGSRGANEDALIEGLKQSICKDVPVVVDVKTFAKFEFVPGNGNYIKEDDGLYRKVNKEKGEKGDYNKGTQWLSDSLKANNGYIVDTNITGYGWEGAHAICICGYDSAYQPDKHKPAVSSKSAVSAFKFKNSWGEGYGNEGYAWITEDYVRQYTYNGLVLDINGRQ